MLGFPPTTEKVAMGRRASRLSRERGVWPPQFAARDGPAASAGRTQRPSPSAATASTVLTAGRSDLRWRLLLVCMLPYWIGHPPPPLSTAACTDRSPSAKNRDELANVSFD